MQQQSKGQAVSHRVEVQQRHVQSYSGPLPHPEHFAQFNAVLPGAAERIMQMAEHQNLHRRQMERREQTLEHVYAGTGLVFAFLICMAAIVGAVICIRAGHNVGGTLLGGVGIATVAGLLIAGRRTVKRA